MTEKRILTVSELTTHIKGVLEHDTLLDGVTVTGEISNYKTYPSGHHYFSLKDAESSVRCVMFRSSAQRLRFRPENGMSVAATGRIAVYPRDGAYQLYCTSLVPIGLGDLYAAFEQLKSRLAAEGLFDPAHKKPLPQMPAKIAVITSSAGAAVRDILRILKARWPSSEVILLPVRVQGVEAPAEIAGAIRYANTWHVADLIITGRGGGSMEDLWAFNDERVARAIYASQIPVISAVGHEPDVTISDYVADRRASTPSNAAEIAVPDQQEMREALESYGIRSRQAMEKSLRVAAQRLDALRNKRVLTEPGAFLDSRRLDLDRLRDRLLASEERQLAEKRQRFVKLGASLDAMSPLRVLSRGYALATGREGKPLRSVRGLAKGDEITVRFQDGQAACRVEQVQEGEERYGR